MLKEVLVPDIGSYTNVNIIEISVSPGDVIEVDSGLITLETDKATLEVPSPYAGIVKTVLVKAGDKVSEGTHIITLEVTEGASVEKKADQQPQTSSNVVKAGAGSQSAASVKADERSSRESKPSRQGGPKSGIIHAGPSVRRFARELGVDLSKVEGNGPKDRILKTDVQSYVKETLSRGGSDLSGITGGALPPWPDLDYAKFGPISREPLSRIKKLSGSFLHRNWLMVPHVTQFDEADITDLERLRKEQQPLAEQQGVKLTPLVFIMKAVVASLKMFPTFNATLDVKNGELIVKKYYHMGIAVDTPEGLVVPVVRDVDQKDLFSLSKELGEISQRARAGQLSGAELQGNTFTVSSLGGIGGSAFTPIVNVPDVAILGVSKAQMKPVYDGSEFKPKLILPLSLSYDHRIIDGAQAARFTTYLAKQLSDIRQLLA